MRRFTLIVVLTLICITSLYAKGGTFSYSPLKPKPGEQITISYNPGESEIAKSNQLFMLAHLYGKQINETNELILKKNGKDWSASFKTTDSTYGMLIRFTDGDKYDNNDKKCFSIFMYGKDENPVPGAKAGLGRAYINWIQAFEIDPDAETAYKLFEEEFKLNPGMKKEFFMDYYRAASKLDKDKASQLLNNDTPAFEKTLTQTEEDLIFLSTLYRLGGNTEKYQQIQSACLEKYPKGKLSEQTRFMEYYNSKDPVKKNELGKKFKEDFPSSQYLSTLKMNNLDALLKEGKFEEAYNTIKSDSSATSSMYNSIAWTMFEKETNLSLAKEIAAHGVDLARKEVTKQDGKKPPYYSDKQWAEIKNSSVYAIMDTYGAILLKLGENKAALKLLEEASTLDKGKSADINERYAQALVANKEYGKAKNVLEKCYKAGESTSAMKDLLKESYLNLGKTESDFEKALALWTKDATEKRMEEIKKEMINVPAPQFTLEDFNGSKVSLAELKGKVVIIDFWATWCGPCKASFPGMQKVVNKYSNDSDVQFLFVNSWERAQDKKKSASDFINQNKYTFEVLMDLDDKVITSYKVDGIPTKFIVDKNGSIRFKSVGFAGSDDKLVDELSTMINILK